VSVPGHNQTRASKISWERVYSGHCVPSRASLTGSLNPPPSSHWLVGASPSCGRRVSAGCRRQHGGLGFPLHCTELATHATSGSGYKGADEPLCRAPPMCAERYGRAASGRTRPAERCTCGRGREQRQGGGALCADHLLGGGGRRRQLERSHDRRRRDVLLQRGRRLVELGAAPRRDARRAAARAARAARAAASASASAELRRGDSDARARDGIRGVPGGD
jgi:hypothetical protein